MTVDQREIQAILDRVRSRYPGEPSGPEQPRTVARGTELSSAPSPRRAGEEGIFGSVDEAVRAAGEAFAEYREMGLDRRFGVVDSIRSAMERDARELARLAHEETGLGRAADKEIKNLLVTRKTPGPEDLAPQATTGDRGMTVTEYAPFGVIAAITPTTNPTSTIINNTLAMVSAGNAVVFNVHPAARGVSAENVRRINHAITAAGGPPNLVCAIPEPTIESAQELMHHPGVRILLVTGGPAVVREALKTDKRAITAGSREPAGAGGRVGRCRAGGQRDHPRRVVRQQHGLHRREGGLRLRIEGRRAAAGDGAGCQTSS